MPAFWQTLAMIKMKFSVVLTHFSGLFFICCGVLLSQCGPKNAAKKEDKLLANVYDRNLYLSDLEGVVPENTLNADSVLLVSAYVQRWILEQLMMYEAERNIPKDLNIDELVRNYRASLVRFNFEEQLIAEKLDSTVSDDELRAYYENNPDQFQLESTILKCQLLKLPSEAPKKELTKIWSSKNPLDVAKLSTYAQKWAHLSLLDTERWYTLEEVAALLPKGTLTTDNISDKREGTLTDNDYQFYYRVFEVAKGKTTAPFDYAKDQALKIILHKRKQELLVQWKEDLYQKELRRENIKILK